jgi:SIR2-like protein
MLTQHTLNNLAEPLRQPPADTVLFLGAGASVPFGFPLASQLLGKVYQRLRKRGFKDMKAKDQAFLAQALASLFPALTRSMRTHVTVSLPSVLGVLNHMLVAGARIRFGRTNRTVAATKVLLEQAIAQVLDPKDVTGGKNKRLLRQFAKVLWKRVESESAALGVISTNYDVCVEQVLFHDLFGEVCTALRADPDEEAIRIAKATHRAVARLFDFGTSWRCVYDGTVFPRPEQPRFRWYKLHGSLNWLRCDQCEHLYINPDWTIAPLAAREPTSGNTCHCGCFPLSQLLVTPSLVRDIRESNLLEIWRHALELLRTARQWIFIGYSLPSEDVAIHNILQRAHSARQRGDRPEVLVVDFCSQPDALRVPRARELRDRYLAMLPQAQFYWGGVQQLIADADRLLVRGRQE